MTPTSAALSPARMRALRLMLVTDGRGDAARIRRLVAAVVEGGLRAVQLREPGLSARELAELCEDLRPVLERVGGLLLVNDRADLAAAKLAHGVHLGGHSLQPAAVRRFLRQGGVIGCSAHDPGELAAAAAAGADYASLSPVLATSCKPGAPAIGIERARAWTAAASLPVLWLGGIDRASLAGMVGAGAGGFAVRSALCEAGDPRGAAAELCGLLDGRADPVARGSAAR